MKKSIFDNWSFRKKLFLSHSIVVVIPLLVLGIYAHFRAYEALEIQMEKQSNEITMSVTSNINTLMTVQNEFVKFTSYNRKLKTIVANSYLEPYELSRDLNEHIEPVFWYYQAMHQNYMRDIIIYTEKRTTGIGSFIKVAPEEVLSSEWYQESRGYQKTRWWFDGDKTFAAHNINDPDNTLDVIGMVYVEVKLSDMIDEVTSTLPPGQDIYVIDNNQKVLYGSINHQIDGSKDIEVCIEEVYGDTEDYMAVYSPLKNGDWQVVGVFDKANMYDDHLNIIQMTYLWIVICLIMLVYVISIITRKLFSRLDSLTTTMQTIEKGNLNVEIDIHGTDEIGYMAYRFRKMLKKIDALISEVYVTKLKEKEARFRTLQSQIKPHFLYNALSNINWLAIQSGQDEISRITSTLTSFYRTTLNNGKDFTVVENEINNIKSYLEIQCINSEVELDISYDVDENTLKCEMINFILQPLVENALIHGIYEGSKEVGCITISVKQEDSDIVFRVIDNGIGMSQEQVGALLIKDKGGYGIKNVHERIQLQYGETYGISVRSELGKGSEVKLVIPCNSK